MSSASSSQGSAGADKYFTGFELLYKSVQPSVHKEMDVVMALIHFVLVRHAGLRCIGLIGDNKEENEGSELLPDNWNRHENQYGLRYKHKETYFKLLANKSDTLFIVNLINHETQKVSNLAVSPETVVKTSNGSLLTMIPQASEFADRIRNELLTASVFASSTASTTTQTDQPTRIITDPPHMIDRNSRAYIVGPPRPFGGIPDVGRGDLDPLGRGGPGNLFPFPSHPDMRAPGLFPRFDPFGPPDRGVRPNPNPDHFQPPNFGGDHFYM